METFLQILQNASKFSLINEIVMSITLLVQKRDLYTEWNVIMRIMQELTRKEELRGDEEIHYRLLHVREILLVAARLALFDSYLGDLTLLW